ncbi:acyltransferase [Halieaceae bacterium IMCC8485]|uniref:Acyltransferase n=1 Tax=Candidatus Seongchinamella marina TaxID=2518990 RepID=A0ABT3SYM1_9GAMM|nr:acyltransferase [Candidatus Seongchinamella marina]MCX2974686.1 acyltransferase [Candidatus Seongchinamella marina]
MLGSFRYLLALLVTLSHLWSSMAGWSGVAAVFGFYVISGYLMTSVINRIYGFTLPGLGRYALNRFLRIFPTYWIVLLLALCIVAAIPREAFLTNYKLSMPLSVTDWLANVFIIGLLDGPYKVLVPPAWTLDIEIFFYVLMGLGLSRSRSVVLIWFGGSLLYTLWLLFNGAEFVDRYASYAAASLPFSAGAMVYMYRSALARFLCLPLPISAGLFLLGLIASRLGWLGDPLVAGFYIILICTVLLLISLNNLEARSFSHGWRKMDRLLGDLAYPIFLCHWQVAAVVLYFFWSGEKPDGGGLWLSSIVFIHAVAFAVYLGVDKRVNLVRDRVRGQH